MTLQAPAFQNDARMSRVAGRERVAVVRRSRTKPPEAAKQGIWLIWGRSMLDVRDLRNWCNGEPLLDWFDLFAGDEFLRDFDAPDHCPELDMGEFVRAQGAEFERRVLGHIGKTIDLKDASIDDPKDVLRWNDRTIELMKTGSAGIISACLIDPVRGLKSCPDLLIRSDVIGCLFTSPPKMSDASAPGVGLDNCHYVAIDVKFSSLELTARGDLGSADRSRRVQGAAYALALESMQGFRPVQSFLIARSVDLHKDKGTCRSCFLRPAPMDVTGAENDLEAAIAWARRVRIEGRDWRPESSSIPEMQLNMGNGSDAPWRRTKMELAQTVRPVTGLWQIGSNASRLYERGIFAWSPDMAIEHSGLTGDRLKTLRAILNAQADGFECTSPAEVQVNRDAWGESRGIEFFVDFETTTDIDDSFDRFPEKGGSPRIFMIGCGHIEDGRWTFEDFTAEALSDDAESDMLLSWLEHMEAVRRRIAPEVERPYVFHWSHAEVSFLSSSYRSAAKRLGVELPELNWYDLLVQVVRPTPFVVNGALNFGLKAIAKSMFALGLIDTEWRGGAFDGVAAMVAGWRCAAEAKRLGVPMSELPLMKRVLEYNCVDCKVMWAILSYWRGSRVTQ